MTGRRRLLDRRNRLAAGGTALVCASMFVLAAPAGASGARVDAHRGYGHAQGAPTAHPSTPLTVTVSPSSLSYPAQRVGTYSGIGKVVTVTNTSSGPVRITAIGSTGEDYFGTSTCFDHPTLAAAASCTITTFFFPTTVGTRAQTLEIKDDAVDSPQKVTLSGTGVEGYYLAGALGGVANFGDAVALGDATNLHLTSPIISLKTTLNGDGYWLLGADGGIFSYGNAAFYGSTGGIHLNQPIVGMERTVTGKGYWLVAKDGGIFSYGDAAFYGSTGAMHLNQPVVGMARTPTGKGYWLVAKDGGVFSFGDAKFFGSTGAITLNQPIIGMASRPNNQGYWMTAADGGVFAFGDAPFYGSPVAAHATITGMAPTPDGGGYWMTTNTGTVFHYGDAPSLGDLPSAGISATDVVGIAPTSSPIPVDFF